MRVVIWAMLLNSVVVAAGVADEKPPPAPSATSRAASLEERQRAIADRVRLLENRMIELVRILDQSEPDKAQRLREALVVAGRRRLRTRLAEAAELLSAGRLDAADAAQRALLADMRAVLEVLTTQLDEAELRRRERQRLEARRKELRTLIDQQQELLEDTSEQAADSDNPDPTAAETLRRRQGSLQRAARALAERLREDRRVGQASVPTEPVDEAAQQMGAAADELGRRRLTPASERQKQALQRLQQTLDDLEQNLRQVRQEERAETLAALESRLRELLADQRRVRAICHEVVAVPAGERGEPERRKISEAADLQRDVAGRCDATLRVVLDEGTTVIVPELLTDALGQMRDVLEELRRGEVNRHILASQDELIALLEELLEAVRRNRDAAQGADGPGGLGDGASQPLLPPSAELKLLRNAQQRINRRTAALRGGSANAARELERLARRQAHLADLSRRMRDRK